jgi:predicted nucleotidyltransferase
LFGSFAYGKPTKHSDVDLVIISPNFSKIDFDQRLDFLTDARDKPTYQIAMDVIGYTPREFANIEKHSAIMAKAKKDGKWIYKAKK